MTMLSPTTARDVYPSPAKYPSRPPSLHGESNSKSNLPTRSSVERSTANAHPGGKRKHETARRAKREDDSDALLQSDEEDFDMETGELVDAGASADVDDDDEYLPRKKTKTRGRGGR
jgi:hypothetical protein